MKQLSKGLLKVLINSFIVSAVCLCLCYFGQNLDLGDSLIGRILFGIGFYGTILTCFLFGLHVLATLLRVILRK